MGTKSRKKLLNHMLVNAISFLKRKIIYILQLRAEGLFSHKGLQSGNMQGGKSVPGEIYTAFKDSLASLHGRTLLFVYFLIKLWRINFNFKKCGKPLEKFVNSSARSELWVKKSIFRLTWFFQTSEEVIITFQHYELHTVLLLY